jgi:hypothetical protein
MRLLYKIDEGLFTGYAQSIADVNDDYMPDLLLTTKDEHDNVLFQVLSMDSQTNQYMYLEKYSPPLAGTIKLYGQSQFADFGKLKQNQMRIFDKKIYAHFFQIAMESSNTCCPCVTTRNARTRLFF